MLRRVTYTLFYPTLSSYCLSTYSNLPLKMLFSVRPMNSTFSKSIRASQSLSLSPSEALLSVDWSFLLSLWVLIIFHLFDCWLSYWPHVLNILVFICSNDTGFSGQISSLSLHALAEFIHLSGSIYQIYASVSKNLYLVPNLFYYKFKNSTISYSSVVFSLECLADT